MLPTLPLNTVADEARIAAALRAAGATVMARYGAALRRAAVAEWEVRLRVPDGSGAWRLVVSSPTGAQPGSDLINFLCNSMQIKLPLRACVWTLWQASSQAPTRLYYPWRFL